MLLLQYLNMKIRDIHSVIKITIHCLKVVVLRERRSQQQCYGCAIASVEQCITLLRAMSTNPLLKDFLCGQGLIKELFNYNLRRSVAFKRFCIYIYKFKIYQSDLSGI